MKNFILIFVGILAGNYLADQSTFKDCATSGRAVMYGGGAVNCKVESV